MEVKERILEGAAQLFLREGVRKVTMDQLASSLGISKRTIYEVFSNKDEILKETILRHINQQRLQTERLSQESETALHFFVSILNQGIENLKAVNPQFVNELRVYYPSIWSSIICTSQDYNIFQTIKIIQRGIIEGVFREDMDVTVVSKFIIESLSILANQDIFPTHIYAPAKLYRDSIITLVRGICSVKGIQMLDNELNSSITN